jgi:glycosyltransferase involved in cell wall biosynthesis
MDKRVKVINKNGGGVSSARNAGIDNATGELVCFFDSDDFVELDFIEKLYTRLGDNDICIGGYIADTYNEKDELITAQNILLGIDCIDNSFPLDNYNKLFALCMSLCNKLYNLRLIQEYNLRFDEKVSFGEDGLFNADFFLLTNKIAFLDYAGYHYIRRKRVSLSTKFYEDFLGIKFRALNRRCELLTHWELSEEKINSFNYTSYFNIIWSEIGNIKNKKYTKNEWRKKIGCIMSNQEIIENVKKYKPKSIKNKIKKIVFLIKNKTLIY